MLLKNLGYQIELFRSTMHQDAHEFLNYILNAIAENVMEQQRKLEKQLREQQEQQYDTSVKSKSTTQNSIEENGTSGNEMLSKIKVKSCERNYFNIYIYMYTYIVYIVADESSLKGSETTSSTNTTNATWVHQLFEGTLTNETKCLTCETVNFFYRFVIIFYFQHCYHYQYPIHY